VARGLAVSAGEGGDAEEVGAESSLRVGELWGGRSAFRLEERAAREAVEPGAGPLCGFAKELALFLFGFPGLFLFFKVRLGFGECCFGLLGALLERVELRLVCLDVFLDGRDLCLGFFQLLFLTLCADSLRRSAPRPD
jgi:hypothetical protein